MIRQSLFNNRTAAFATVFILACESFGAAATVPSPDEDSRSKANTMIENWKAVTPEILREPQNVPIIEELKQILESSPHSAAKVLLIRYGDEQTIQQALTQVRSENPRDRGSAVRDFSLAANPYIIRLLDRDLMKDESPEMKYFGDVGVLPPSMAAASITKATILESSVFPDDVKNWAKRLPKVSPGLRDGVRAWWKVNKAALERGDYQAVVPVEETRGAASAEHDVPATLAQATPISKPLQAATPVALITTSGVERRSTMWLLADGIVALIVTVAYALKRGSI